MISIINHLHSKLFMHVYYKSMGISDIAKLLVCKLLYFIIFFSFPVIMKALKCPYLTRIPIANVRQNASQLLRIADQCPIMGHVMQYSSLANEGPAKPGMSDITDSKQYWIKSLPSILDKVYLLCASINLIFCSLLHIFLSLVFFIVKIYIRII